MQHWSAAGGERAPRCSQRLPHGRFCCKFHHPEGAQTVARAGVETMFMSRGCFPDETWTCPGDHAQMGESWTAQMEAVVEDLGFGVGE